MAKSQAIEIIDKSRVPLGAFFDGGGGRPSAAYQTLQIFFTGGSRVGTEKKMKNKFHDAGSAADLADLLGVPQKAIAQLAASGTVARDKARGRYHLLKSVQKYCDVIRRAATGRESEAVLERRRLLRSQADFAETKSKIECGTLVAADDVLAEWSGILRRIRAPVMAIPSRASARLPSLDRHDVSELDYAAREALIVAADDTPENRRSDATASKLNPPPPGETENER